MTKSLDGHAAPRGVPPQAITDLPCEPSNDRQVQQEIQLGREFTADPDGLAVSLAGVARLSVGRLDLVDLLTRLVTFAAATIPGAEGAGLMLIEPGRADTIVASAPFVREVDDIQYGLGVGPCISAAATGQTVRSGSIGADRRWPQFGARVARLGVHSVLSLPLFSHKTVIGSLNVYAHAELAFDGHAEQVGELFAAPAAIVVQDAQILAQTRRLAEDVHAVLASRAVIDQAIGILMSRLGVSADEASNRLRALSQREPVNVAEVAAGIVQAAVRQAQARHPNRT